MRIYFNALIGTLGLGLVILGLFYFWQQGSSKNHGRESVDLLDSIEKHGMIDFETDAIFGDTSGKKFRLSELKGRKFILNFWASWCGPCIDEFPSMLKMVSSLPNDILIVAVSADNSDEGIEEFVKLFPGLRKNPQVIVIWDKDLRIGKSYQAERLPESYIVGSDFKMVRKVSGSIKWDTAEAIEFIKSVK